jgi:hypothetical protein
MAAQLNALSDIRTRGRMTSADILRYRLPGGITIYPAFSPAWMSLACSHLVSINGKLHAASLSSVCLPLLIGGLRELCGADSYCRALQQTTGYGFRRSGSRF